MIKKILEGSMIIFFSILMIQFGAWAFVENWNYPNIFPSEISFRMWDTALSKKELSTLGFSVIIAYPIAKALALYEIKYKGIIRFILIIPFLIPMTSISMGIHLSFIKLGIANNVIGVILLELFVCIPYAVLGLEPIIKIVGDDIEKQARSLGASSFMTFRKITLPLISPGLVITSTLVFLVSISQYFVVSLTYTLIMFPYIYAKDRHISSIYGIIFLVTCVIVIMVFRFMISWIYKEKKWKF